MKKEYHCLHLIYLLTTTSFSIVIQATKRNSLQQGRHDKPFSWFKLISSYMTVDESKGCYACSDMFNIIKVFTMKNPTIMSSEGGSWRKFHWRVCELDFKLSS